MTTIEFGGGPTLAARRRFTNLPDGSHVPKYTGHIHQLRYRHGHTYGEETHRLAQENPLSSRSKSALPTVITDPADPYETHVFPDGMLPGYTGYIPQRKYQLGNRYRVEADTCLAGSKQAYEQNKNETKHFQRTISAYPRMQNHNSGTVVKHFLDYHRAYRPTDGSQQSDRRDFVEPPIPGYTGFVPRIRPTDIGLGARYHEAARRGLNRFAFETAYSTTNFPISVEVNAPSSQLLTASTSSLTSSPQRLYSNSGMIPQYTGYLPQRKYHVGQTYGDTSRTLPVCAHSFPNFGAYVRSKSAMNMKTNGAY